MFHTQNSVWLIVTHTTMDAMGVIFLKPSNFLEQMEFLSPMNILLTKKNQVIVKLIGNLQHKLTTIIRFLIKMIIKWLHGLVRLLWQWPFMQTKKNGNSTKMEPLTTLHVIALNSITELLPLAMTKMISSLRTHGEKHGECKVISK